MATQTSYSYRSTLEAAHRINWRIEDIIGNTKRLDFTKPFLPNALARVQEIQCLNTQEKQLLNQIRGNSYLYLFGLVEEFILPLVVDHVRHLGNTDMYATQAFLCFAEEESKHIELFRQFSKEFDLGFGTPCGCIGPAQEIANTVLQHSPLGVALLTLHIEWMTQKHYLESVQENKVENLDPQFSSLLRHHWLEEAQHARLDTLMVESLAEEVGPQGIEAAIEDYIALVNIFDGGFKAQVQLDIQSLETASGRSFTEAEKQEIQSAQIASYRWTFLGSGMTHPNFEQTLRQISPTGYIRVANIAKAFC